MDSQTGLSTQANEPSMIDCAKNTIHQVTTVLAISKNVLFPGYNHLHWWPFTLIITLAGAQAIIKVSGHQYQWLVGGYNLEIGHF